MEIKNFLQDDVDEGLAVLTFKVDARQFDLNRDLKYISMKDQIIRARTLIFGAFKADLISEDFNVDKNSVNVAIFGAGIAGISAALAVNQLGLSAVVIEKADECFPLLGMGTDRLFSATVYDWPHCHSGVHSFPYISTLRDKKTRNSLLQSSGLKFPQGAVKAKDLRAHLVNQVKNYEVQFAGKLDIRRGWTIPNMKGIYLNESSRELLARVKSPSGGEEIIRAQIAVFALGFGLDQNAVQIAAARDFYSYDRLHSDINRALIGNKTIRIIGCGDGGLQEALRFILADQYHDLHAAISRLAEIVASKGAGEQWLRMCASLQSAEDHAIKSSMWGYNEEIVFSELDRYYVEQLDAFLRDNLNAAKEWAEEVVRNASISIEMIDQSLFSKRVYGLNRFLILILQKLTLSDKKTRLVRLQKNSTKSADVVLSRLGFGAADRPKQIGTASAEDLLRRVAFRAVPMNLDVVI